MTGACIGEGDDDMSQCVPRGENVGIKEVMWMDCFYINSSLSCSKQRSCTSVRKVRDYVKGKRVTACRKCRR